MKMTACALELVTSRSVKVGQVYLNVQAIASQSSTLSRLEPVRQSRRCPGSHRGTGRRPAVPLRRKPRCSVTAQHGRAAQPPPGICENCSQPFPLSLCPLPPPTPVPFPLPSLIPYLTHTINLLSSHQYSPLLYFVRRKNGW